jgi:hypothetical protein
VFDVRIARERVIASLHDMPAIPLQQGLFDRRAARQDDLRRAAASDAAAETARQIRALEHAAQVSIGPTRLVLVLIPKFAGCR